MYLISDISGAIRLQSMMSKGGYNINICNIHSMKLGIVACDILKHEIESLVSDDPDFVQKEYLEYSIHVFPEVMKEKILEAVDKVKDNVDGILLGFAVCQSLENFTDELDIPAVMLDGADCIEVVLGPEEYEKEKKICPGTWFSTPGWAENGKNGLIKEMHLDAMMDEGFPPEMFLDIIFDAYSRCLYIDTGIGNNDYYVNLSEKFTQELNFTHECRTGNTKNIEIAMAKMKKLFTDDSLEN